MARDSLYCSLNNGKTRSSITLLTDVMAASITGAHSAQERTQTPLQTNLISYNIEGEEAKEWYISTAEGRFQLLPNAAPCEPQCAKRRQVFMQTVWMAVCHTREFRCLSAWSIVSMQHCKKGALICSGGSLPIASNGFCFEGSSQSAPYRVACLPLKFPERQPVIN